MPGVCIQNHWPPDESGLILTIIPAVAVSLTSQYGFQKTFFGEHPGQAATKCLFFKNAFKEMSGKKEQPSSDGSPARDNKL